MNTFDNRPRQAGFTLVELLVVIAIIAILGGLGLTVFSGARRDSEEFEAQAFIQAVGASLEVYKSDRKIGVFPPSTLDHFKNRGKKVNKTNEGIETLVVCLSSSGFKGKKLNDEYDGLLENLDGDFSNKPLTDAGATDLFEIMDPWGNPYVYFNADDYENKNVQMYTAFEDPNADAERVNVKPWKNPKTKAYYNRDSFQLFSAGPDMKFNTEDDIGNWSSR